MLNDGEKGVILQRDKKTYAVAPHIPCGMIDAAMLRKLADLADKHNIPAMKITSAARVALIGLREDQVDQVWADLDMDHEADAGRPVGLCVRSVKACPGTTFCKRGIQDSVEVGMLLDQKYHGMQLPGKMKIGISGCPNQCAETCIKDIGLVGTAKGWRVLVGGNGGFRPRLADVLAQRLSTDDAVALVDKVIDYFKANAEPRERLGKVIDRLGLTHLEEAVGL